MLASQTWIENLTQGKPSGEEKVISATAAGITVYLPVTGLVDVDKMLPILHKDIAKAEAEITKLKAQLDNPQFVERAKPEAVEKLRGNLEDASSRLAKLQERLALFS